MKGTGESLKSWAGSCCNWEWSCELGWWKDKRQPGEDPHPSSLGCGLELRRKSFPGALDPRSSRSLWTFPGGSGAELGPGPPVRSPRPVPGCPGAPGAACARLRVPWAPGKQPGVPQGAGRHCRRGEVKTLHHSPISPSEGSKHLRGFGREWTALMMVGMGCSMLGREGQREDTAPALPEG